MIWHNGIGIDRVGRNIHRGDAVVHFNKKRGFDMMCHLILGPPKNIDEIFEQVYIDCEDGGPDSGSAMVYVFFAQKRKAFEKLKLVLHKDRACHNKTRYQLVPEQIHG